MGVKESDNYHTGGAVGAGADSDLRNRRSWGHWMRNGIEDLRMTYFSNNATTERLSRRGKEFVDEHVPS
jgi:hypothetical protein